MKIAGLDIGGETGIVIVDTETGSIEEQHIVERSKDNRDTALAIISYLDKHKSLDVVVSEQFRGLVKSVDTMNAAKVESMVQFWYFMGSLTYVRQYPAVRTGFIPVAKKLASTEGKHRCHIVDALAHVLRYLYREHRGYYDKILGGVQ